MPRNRWSLRRLTGFPTSAPASSPSAFLHNHPVRTFHSQPGDPGPRTAAFRNAFRADRCASILSKSQWERQHFSSSAQWTEVGLRRSEARADDAEKDEAPVDDTPWQQRIAGKQRLGLMTVNAARGRDINPTLLHQIRHSLLRMAEAEIEELSWVADGTVKEIPIDAFVAGRYYKKVTWALLARRVPVTALSPIIEDWASFSSMLYDTDYRDRIKLRTATLKAILHRLVDEYQAIISKQDKGDEAPPQRIERERTEAVLSMERIYEGTKKWRTWSASVRWRVASIFLERNHRLGLELMITELRMAWLPSASDVEDDDSIRDEAHDAPRERFWGTGRLILEASANLREQLESIERGLLSVDVPEQAQSIRSCFRLSAVLATLWRNGYLPLPRPAEGADTAISWWLPVLRSLCRIEEAWQSLNRHDLDRYDADLMKYCTHCAGLVRQTIYDRLMAFFSLTPESADLKSSQAPSSASNLYTDDDLNSLPDYDQLLSPRESKGKRREELHSAEQNILLRYTLRHFPNATDLMTKLVGYGSAGQPSSLVDRYIDADEQASQHSEGLEGGVKPERGKRSNRLQPARRNHRIMLTTLLSESIRLRDRDLEKSTLNSMVESLDKPQHSDPLIEHSADRSILALLREAIEVGDVTRQCVLLRTVASGGYLVHQLTSNPRVLPGQDTNLSLRGVSVKNIVDLFLPSLNRVNLDEEAAESRQAKTLSNTEICTALLNVITKSHSAQVSYGFFHLLKAEREKARKLSSAQSSSTEATEPSKNKKKETSMPQNIDVREATIFLLGYVHTIRDCCTPSAISKALSATPRKTVEACAGEFLQHRLDAQQEISALFEHWGSSKTGPPPLDRRFWNAVFGALGWPQMLRTLYYPTLLQDGRHSARANGEGAGEGAARFFASTREALERRGESMTSTTSQQKSSIFNFFQPRIQVPALRGETGILDPREYLGRSNGAELAQSFRGPAPSANQDMLFELVARNVGSDEFLMRVLEEIVKSGQTIPAIYVHYLWTKGYDVAKFDDLLHDGGFNDSSNSGSEDAPNNPSASSEDTTSPPPRNRPIDSTSTSTDAYSREELPLTSTDASRGIRIPRRRQHPALLPVAKDRGLLRSQSRQRRENRVRREVDEEQGRGTRQVT